ncbi:PREDICTED: mitochondrial peptide methionine sulfoxide reductase [Condylura cristata]|uniref:mitochondrial peptide methionine sulfoxide reductase n=1 Tax=Condylura cristata TaxID=143302 RepID=UPI0006434510|nr:PREDICTED: mitochondrial peptide methionine sulfoxide reductase [Condylura cristata]
MQMGAQDEAVTKAALTKNLEVLTCVHALVACFALELCSYPTHHSAKHHVNGNRTVEPFPEGAQMALFGMGCFWGAERKFWTLKGVYSTQVGFAGGCTANPTYREVCSGKTGHAEVVRVVFQPERVSFEELLKVFWENHDPTQGMRQGNDHGSQYRSAIYPACAQHLEAALRSRDDYQKGVPCGRRREAAGRCVGALARAEGTPPPGCRVAPGADGTSGPRAPTKPGHALAAFTVRGPPSAFVEGEKETASLTFRRPQRHAAALAGQVTPVTALRRRVGEPIGTRPPPLTFRRLVPEGSTPPRSPAFGIRRQPAAALWFLVDPRLRPASRCGMLRRHHAPDVKPSTARVSTSDSPILAATRQPPCIHPSCL